MLREIRKRMIIIKNRMPFDPEIKSYFAELENLDWLYTNMNLEGSALSREQVDEISKGEVLMNFSLDEHLMVQNLGKLLNKMYGFLDMKRTLETKLLEEMYEIIHDSGDAPAIGSNLADEYGDLCEGVQTKTPYRKRNIICYQWDYTPPHPAEIGECMPVLNQLFDKAMDANSEREECFEFAERIHNAVIALQPFRDSNALIARAAAAYYLIAKGYPAVVTKMKENEYNEMVAKALKTGDLQGFNEAFKKEILDRMKLMIQLTAH